jgi:hypothetical protein
MDWAFSVNGLGLNLLKFEEKKNIVRNFGKISSEKIEMNR